MPTNRFSLEYRHVVRGRILLTPPEAQRPQHVYFIVQRHPASDAHRRRIRCNAQNSSRGPVAIFLSAWLPHWSSPKSSELSWPPNPPTMSNRRFHGFLVPLNAKRKPPGSASNSDAYPKRILRAAGVFVARNSRFCSTVPMFTSNTNPNATVDLGFGKPLSVWNRVSMLALPGKPRNQSAIHVNHALSARPTVYALMIVFSSVAERIMPSSAASDLPVGS